MSRKTRINEYKNAAKIIYEATENGYRHSGNSFCCNLLNKQEQNAFGKVFKPTIRQINDFEIEKVYGYFGRKQYLDHCGFFGEYYYNENQTTYEKWTQHGDEYWKSNRQTSLEIEEHEVL